MASQESQSDAAAGSVGDSSSSDLKLSESDFTNLKKRLNQTEEISIQLIRRGNLVFDAESFESYLQSNVTDAGTREKLKFKIAQGAKRVKTNLEDNEISIGDSETTE